MVAFLLDWFDEEDVKMNIGRVYKNRRRYARFNPPAAAMSRYFKLYGLKCIQLSSISCLI